MRASLVKAAPQLTPIGGLSPAVREMSQIVSALSPNSQLAREGRAFTDGEFAPLNPVAPYPVDRPGPSGRPEPRRWQYPIGFNLPTQPGATKLIDFQTLRNMADLHGVTRRCIEIRKTEIANADWEITVRARSKKDALTKLQDKATQQAIERVTKFFERPDPIQGRSFGAWIKAILEEVLVIDALALYIHPSWDGSQLAALELVAGDTIKPVIDLRGARPQPPNPAYQQYLYGYPRSEFTGLDEPQALTEADLAARGIKTQFSTDQMLYKPYVERANSPYGFSPVEQIILAINLALKREQWHLSYFTDSNVPAGFIQAPETWTAGNIQSYQDAFDALLAGDATWKRRIKVIPAGTKFEQLKPPTYEMDFDHFLIRLVCLGLDVMPGEIGFPPETGLGGKGWSDAEAATAKRKSRIPMQRWLKTEVIDHIIATQFGRPDLQFRWLEEEHDDSEAQENIDGKLVATGRMTIDQWRVENDMEPFGFPETQEPMIITGTGPVMLKDFKAKQEQQDALAQQQAKTQMDVAKKPPVDPNKQMALQAAKQQPAGKPNPRPSAAKLADLSRWERKARKALKEGRSADVRFESEHIPEGESAALHALLAAADTPEKIAAVFEVAEGAPTRPAKVIIVRHPKTALNAKDDGEDGSPERFRGWIDVPPDAKGKTDAAAMRDELCAKFDFDKVYSSDLKRATYLADLLAKSCDQPAEESIGYRPWDLGTLAGKEITPEVLGTMKDAVRSPDQALPGGETFQAFLDRFLPALRAALDYAQTDGKTVAVVTHTRNIRVALDWLAGDQNGTEIKPDAILQKDDPVQPGGYIVLTNTGRKWKVDRGQSNEEDGSGEPAEKVAVAAHEANRHPAWLTEQGAKLEQAFRTLETTFFDDRLREFAETPEPTP